MQELSLSWSQVVRAGTVLFGASFGESADDGAWREELKRAYRRRVLESHPDRAQVLGRSEQELVDEFRQVQEAFSLLEQLRDAPLPPRPRARPPTPPVVHVRVPPVVHVRVAAEPSPERVRRDATRSAGVEARARRRTDLPLPDRKLRLAEYLYYLGIVRSADVGAAVAWQRAQRPPVGRIAERFGYLQPSEVARILKDRLRQRDAHAPFATFAVAEGWLTPFQRLVLLGHQRRLQQPIGAWFVERGLVTDAELRRYCAALTRHNFRQAA